MENTLAVAPTTHTNLPTDEVSPVEQEKPLLMPESVPDSASKTIEDRQVERAQKKNEILKKSYIAKFENYPLDKSENLEETFRTHIDALQKLGKLPNCEKEFDTYMGKYIDALSGDHFKPLYLSTATEGKENILLKLVTDTLETFATTSYKANSLTYCQKVASAIIHCFEFSEGDETFFLYVSIFLKIFNRLEKECADKLEIYDLFHRLFFENKSSSSLLKIQVLKAQALQGYWQLSEKQEWANEQLKSFWMEKEDAEYFFKNCEPSQAFGLSLLDGMFTKAAKTNSCDVISHLLQFFKSNKQEICINPMRALFNAYQNFYANGDPDSFFNTKSGAEIQPVLLEILRNGSTDDYREIIQDTTLPVERRISALNFALFKSSPEERGKAIGAFIATPSFVIKESIEYFNKYFFVRTTKTGQETQPSEVYKAMCEALEKKAKNELLSKQSWTEDIDTVIELFQKCNEYMRADQLRFYGAKEIFYEQAEEFKKHLSLISIHSPIDKEVTQYCVELCKKIEMADERFQVVLSRILIWGTQVETKQISADLLKRLEDSSLACSQQLDIIHLLAATSVNQQDLLKRLMVLLKEKLNEIEIRKFEKIIEKINRLESAGLLLTSIQAYLKETCLSTKDLPILEKAFKLYLLLEPLTEKTAQSHPSIEIFKNACSWMSLEEAGINVCSTFIMAHKKFPKIKDEYPAEDEFMDYLIKFQDVESTPKADKLKKSALTCLEYIE